MKFDEVWVHALLGCRAGARSSCRIHIGPFKASLDTLDKAGRSD